MRRTRVILGLRVILPLAALAILSVLFLLGRSPDPDAAIPYARGRAEDLARDPGITAPHYAGVTPDGAAITLRAARAHTEGGDGGMAGGGTAAQVTLDWTGRDGLTARLSAGAAGIDGTRIHLSQDVRMTLSTGYALTGERFEADTARDGLTAPAPVRVTAPFGIVEAGGMALNRTGTGTHVLDLNGGVRLVYRP